VDTTHSPSLELFFKDFLKQLAGLAYSAWFIVLPTYALQSRAIETSRSARNKKVF